MDEHPGWQSPEASNQLILFNCNYHSFDYTYSIHSDSLFELISIVMNIAIWLMKHATHVATTDEITMEEAKEVHRSLKLSAGMFLHIKESLVTRLPATTEKGVDCDARVIEAYAQQAQAEAQEGAVTMVTAKHLTMTYTCIYSLYSNTRSCTRDGT